MLGVIVSRISSPRIFCSREHCTVQKTIANAMKNSIRFTGLSHKEEKKLFCFPPHSEFMMNLSILLIPNQNRIIYRELAVIANLFHAGI